MRLFDVPQAKHYCRAFSATLGSAAGSLKAFYASDLKSASVLKEGTAAFGAYRDCALRDAERCLFLAVSQYRRGADLILPSASGWAHVTMYYGAYFAANAVLGMFGAWMNDWVLVEVSAGTPGHQELAIDRHARRRSTHRGSHQRFWDLFYTACAPLLLEVDPSLRFAIEPVAGSGIWQIENRNAVNYDTFVAWELGRHLKRTFRGATFPGCLPGVLGTQFQVFEALMLVALRFARDLGLRTDALNLLGPKGTRGRKMRDLIFDCPVPTLTRKLRRRGVLV